MDFSTFIFDQALILIPALYVLGTILKEWDQIKDNWIPAILLIFGVAGALAMMGVTPRSTPEEIVQAVVQGVLVTGAAVYTNQLIKQHQKTIPDDGKDENAGA
ncbi:Phage holin family Hol44, holin superfamily V [Geosporobacter subterraneus DSM 17957]|uniref:Phage holin family Hol44, holin superfamily V n=1 Tax=Geosporobacter subterraneus DSM 17957 TaxID=1121919 RepID=A0A1M6DNX3_9FIRM|nr:phage holin family protein [Geosporobacter subterraneus]SHI74668.1 Phage holin family Hol44, holin superfamily V [Geosporobacter subterraneus DSM 17957]